MLQGHIPYASFTKFSAFCVQFHVLTTEMRGIHSMGIEVVGFLHWHVFPQNFQRCGENCWMQKVLEVQKWYGPHLSTCRMW